MLKDKAKKDYQREYMRLKRSNKITGLTEGSNKEYPAILQALTDPIKRRKLEKIYQLLRDFKQEKNVYYGYPDNGIPFDLVGELLEVTRG